MVRALLFLATIAYVVYLHNNPDLIEEIKEAGLKSHDDIIEWGKDKVAFNFTNISHRTITYNVPEGEEEKVNGELKDGADEIQQEESVSGMPMTENE